MAAVAAGIVFEHQVSTGVPLNEVIAATTDFPANVPHWPRLGPMSVVASRMALASRYQDKFIESHDALMAINSKLTEAKIREALSGAGVDVDTCVFASSDHTDIMDQHGSGVAWAESVLAGGARAECNTGSSLPTCN